MAPLYEFVQNGDFDARNFFQPSVAAVHYNYFGGTIGGPIKKNKLFFFADYLAYHRSRSQRQHRDDTVAAVAYRQPERGAGWLQPRPGLRSANRRSDHRNRKDSIPGQYHSHIAPEPDRAQDPGPGAQIRTKSYNTLAPSNNYFALLPFTKDTNFTDGKIDYTISDKDRLSGRFSFQRPVIYQAPIFGTAGGDANGAFEGTGVQKTYSSGINWNHVFSPTLLNEFRFGVAHYHNVGARERLWNERFHGPGNPRHQYQPVRQRPGGYQYWRIYQPAGGIFRQFALDPRRSQHRFGGQRDQDVTATTPSRSASICAASVTTCLQTQTYSPRGVYTFGACPNELRGKLPARQRHHQLGDDPEQHHFVGQRLGELPARHAPGGQHRPRL